MRTLDLRYGRYIQQVLANLPDFLKRKPKAKARFKIFWNREVYSGNYGDIILQEHYRRCQERGTDWIVLIGWKGTSIRIVEQPPENRF